MDAFCSWSGGKDSCLACYRALDDYDVSRFVTMLVDETGTPDLRSYRETLRCQSRATGIPLVEERVTWETYEAGFDRVLGALELEYGVFGTIDVDEHRVWVEETCDAHGVTPVLPLWGEEPADLYREFVDCGFEAVVVKVDPERIDQRWLGESLDSAFLDYLLDRDVHPMGEGGEYHTLTVDGPLFERRVELHVDGATATAGGLIANIEQPGAR